MVGATTNDTPGAPRTPAKRVHSGIVQIIRSLRMEAGVDERMSNRSESDCCRHGPMVTHLVGGSVPL